MKVAIKANPSRGKEIISLLESLGGINSKDWKGDGELDIYYIDKNNIIQYDSPPKDYKVHTLEEFEKEFPFKIGDKVKHLSSICTIRKYCYINNKPCYEVESVEFGIIATIPVKLLEPYKEMDVRRVTVTLDKAKEWYKKGGALKEIALQAFSEKELTKVDLPKTWKEFCDNYPVQAGECWLGSCDHIFKTNSEEERTFRNCIPSKKSAEAHLAMIQLEQLRNCWRQDWIPNWLDANEEKYVIKRWKNESSIEIAWINNEFLSFPTGKMAEEFLKCFKGLIEQAGDLI